MATIALGSANRGSTQITGTVTVTGPVGTNARTWITAAVFPGAPTATGPFISPEVPVGVQPQYDATLTGLTPDTNYNLQAWYQEDGMADPISGGPLFELDTFPIVECFGAGSISDTGATLPGAGHNIVNNNRLGFQWGTVPGGPYPNLVASDVDTDGSNTQNYDAPITGLTPGTTYYFVPVELDPTGTTVINTGDECTFETTGGAACDFELTTFGNALAEGHFVFSQPDLPSGDEVNPDPVWNTRIIFTGQGDATGLRLTIPLPAQPGVVAQRTWQITNSPGVTNLSATSGTGAIDITFDLHQEPPTDGAAIEMQINGHLVSAPLGEITQVATLDLGTACNTANVPLVIETDFDVFAAACAPPTNITAASADLSVTIDAAGQEARVDVYSYVRWWVSPDGGTTKLYQDAGGANSDPFTFAGLTAETEYTYGYQIMPTAGNPDDTTPISAENTCGTFTTLQASEPPGGVPLAISCTPGCAPNVAQQLPVAPPCSNICDGAGNGGGGADVEQLILCDIDANGELLGTAIAVYEYDAQGSPVGAPTFVDPVTGNPYVPQGTLQPCATGGCGGPMQFCFTSTSTGPVEHPGRVYDASLPINPGFALESVTIDGTTHAANILWSVNDADGSDFAAALQSFLAPRFPTATVTVTNPNAGTVVCGTGLPFAVHIECIRLDAPAPNTVDFTYNGGQDLVINPAYNTTPPTNLDQFQFHYLQRQDAGGTVNCTTTANRGWETNDRTGGGFGGRDFEIWGRGPSGLQTIEGATPTPRGTPIQEVSADGTGTGTSPTIWQTFEVLAAGTFNLVLVHGARDFGEVHTIRLSTGDTDDFGAGDIINNVTTPQQVTNSGGRPAEAWTEFNQSVFLNPGVYTFSFATTEPVGNQRGGLFTDMRAFTDAPGQIETATTEDTCTVETEETSNTTDCQWWQPQCSNGDIVAWRNVETGQVLSNAAFWGQTPAPSCCTSEASSGGGGSVNAGNLVHNYEVCGVVGGISRTLNRVVITDQSGGAIGQTFIGPDGGPVTPTSWTPGACRVAPDNPTTTDICVQVDNGPVQQWTAIFTGATSSNLQGYRNALGEFVPALPAGAVIVPCQADGLVDDVELFTELGCAANVPYTRLTTRQYDNTGTQIETTTIYLDSAGVTVAPPVGFTLGPCQPTAQPQFDHDLLCEPEPSDVRVIVVTSYDEIGTPSVSAYVFPTLVPYAGDLSQLVTCETAQPDPNAVEIDQYDTVPVPVCFQQGPLTVQWLTNERVLFNNTAPGTEVSRTRHWFNPLTNTDQTALPAGTAVPCDGGIQVVESEELGCANGIPWSRRRTGFFDNNGQLITVVYTFVDSDGNEQPTAPAGFLLGNCPDESTTSQNERYTTTVATVGPSQTLNIPGGGGNLVSWSVRARSPGVAVTVNGVTITLDDGETIDANAASSGAGGDGIGGILVDVVSVVTGPDESARVVYQNRTIV